MVAIKAGFIFCESQILVEPRHDTFGLGYHLLVDFEHTRRHCGHKIAERKREVLFEVLFVFLIPKFGIVFVIEIQKVERPLRKRCH